MWSTNAELPFGPDSHAEVDRLAAVVVQAGARNVEGPLYEEPRYYAVFFEDPSGNRLEIRYPADGGWSAASDPIVVEVRRIHNPLRIFLFRIAWAGCPVACLATLVPVCIGAARGSRIDNH